MYEDMICTSYESEYVIGHDAAGVNILFGNGVRKQSNQIIVKSEKCLAFVSGCPVSICLSTTIYQPHPWPLL
jgi:hypothetical protein